MEEVRNHQEEHVLPAKRKPDPEFAVEAATEGQDDESSKKAKLENSVDGAAEDKKIGKGSQNDAEIDRKGKAIRSDDKGKGKLVEDDLSDDPLAEVDLDNILPSRTRRRSVHPGVFISSAAGNPKHDGDSDA
nr:nucleolin-like [Ipomoea batatas]